MSREPNLFVVGAAKAGTTSLYRALAEQRQVFMSPIKELHYYSTDIDRHKFSREYKETIVFDDHEALRRSKSGRVFSTHMRDRAAYLALFEGADPSRHKYLGEVSPSYLYSRVAAESISRASPGAKIVMILRKPIDRAFSHYLMDVSIGYVKLGFAACLERELSSSESCWGRDTQYIALGAYAEQVKRYLDAFPREDVMIILYDDFAADYREVLRNLFSFLDIGNPAMPENRRHNQAQLPRYPRLNYALRRLYVKKAAKELVPQEIKRIFKRLYYQKMAMPSPSERERAIVNGALRDDIPRLGELIGRDLRLWLT